MELVREKVPENLECPLKFCGWEDKEFLEIFLENTESLKRLTNTNTISFILPVRVTNSKIKLFWLSIFTSLNLKRLKPLNLLSNKKREDKRTRIRDKSKSKIKRLGETSNEHEYYIIEKQILFFKYYYLFLYLLTIQ